MRRSTENPVVRVYAGELELAPPFAGSGGFINFGYWKQEWFADDHILTQEDRMNASKRLYQAVFNSLDIDFRNLDRPLSILEIGTGTGIGSALAYEIVASCNGQFRGIDITPEQVKKCQDRFKDNPFMRFHVAPADDVNFGLEEKDHIANESIDIIYSVEAAQCFPSISAFGRQAYRLLKPGGKLGICCHLSTTETGYQEVRKLIKTVDAGVDRLIPVSQFFQELSLSGLRIMELRSIGKHVFYGYSKWLHAKDQETWSEKVIQLYERGCLDYYLIICIRD
jgi:ubiquinone/menaquinone biosynthesis C-methylase UbiE